MIFDEFHKIVRLNGWVQIRQMSTSHIIYKKGKRTDPVPYHKGKEVGKGLEAIMKKDMKLKYK